MRNELFLIQVWREHAILFHFRKGGPNGGQAFRHMGQVLVCPGGDCTFIHLDVGCAIGATWTISGSVMAAIVRRTVQLEPVMPNT